MLIGYARISTDTQVLYPQIESLIKYGVDERNIYKEQISTRALHRPELEKALAYLKKGDTFVVCKLDRFGRSLEYLIRMMNYFQTNGINFVSLTENLDTSTAIGKMHFQMIATFTEFERDLISERTKEGLISARKRGKSLGRPFILGFEQKELIDRYVSEGKSKLEIKRVLGIKSTTPIYNYLKTKENKCHQK